MFMTLRFRLSITTPSPPFSSLLFIAGSHYVSSQLLSSNDRKSQIKSGDRESVCYGRWTRSQYAPESASRYLFIRRVPGAAIRDTKIVIAA